jgi:predicted Fe-Mo cluster-binding NifX family protein
MKICIPVTEDKGPASKVSEHFGRAPFHILADLDTMEMELLRKEGECGGDDHGHCVPVDLLLANGVELVACKGIGRAALGRMMSHDIDVFAAHVDTVAEVIEEYRRRGREARHLPRICESHGHHHLIEGLVGASLDCSSFPRW